MVEGATETKRKRPKFIRRDYHKKIRLGKGRKKIQKWRAVKGRHNKVRLGQKGYPVRPTVGFGEKNKIKGHIMGLVPIRIENLKGLEGLKAGSGIIIASVGKKKKNEIISKANEMKLKILNRYKEKKK